ncbi:MAG: hypothetical protein F6K57_38900, partial [Moorea sp. SIO4A5]|nr:hypothetical protein [Moorena sp. SIO4A5]
MDLGTGKKSCSPHSHEKLYKELKTLLQKKLFDTATPYSLLPTPYSLLPTPYSRLQQRSLKSSHLGCQNCCLVYTQDRLDESE